MLLFTPDVKEYLEWFALTHQLQGGYGWMVWQLTKLPANGGVEDQPAKVMEALALIAREENALIQRRQKQQAKGPRQTEERHG